MFELGLTKTTVVPAHAGVILENDLDKRIPQVVPAHAGVIPKTTYQYTLLISCSRTCGGDPKNFLIFSNISVLFPHMRG